MARLRVLYLGPGHNAIARGRVAPFLDAVEALWISTEPFPEAFLEQHPGLRAEVLPRPFLRRLPRRLFLHTADYLAEVWARVLTFRPDVVHVHYLSQLDALALLPVRHVPLVITVMGGDVLEDQVPRAAPIDRAVRRVLRRAAAVTAKSAFLERACTALGARNVHRVPWGIETQRFASGDRAAARRELGLPVEGRVLMSCRALQPLYNQRSLVRALGRAQSAGEVEGVTLAVVEHAADPTYAREVLGEAEAAGVRVHRLPAQPASAMPAIYAAADVIASLPRSDGLPQTLLEAMASERPCVGLALEAYAELPFAAPAFERVSHQEGEPDLAELQSALARALNAAGPALDESLSAARAWVAAEAEFSVSVEAVRALYREVAR